MIEMDKELQRELEHVRKRLKTVIRELKIYKAIIIVSAIYFFISTSLEVTGLLEYISNPYTTLMLYMLMFWFKAYLFYLIGTSLDEKVEKLTIEREDLPEQEEDIKAFSAYLMSCRKMEALDIGINIYPELREGDCISVINEYGKLYGQKRIEYEKQHISRLKLNKYYLDEKLSKAPIETYPIQEQELLKERQKELNEKLQ